MNTFLKFLLASLFVVTALSGCIRDDISQCPTLSMVLDIKDKTYVNAQSVGYNDPNSESGHFSKIVPTLFYELRDTNTGETVRQMPVTSISSNDSKYTLDFDEELPFGQYEITVWGAMPDGSHILSTDDKYDLTGLTHELFVANATIDYNYDKAIIYGEMQRVNGIVIIETKWDTFPIGICASEKTFTGLGLEVNSDLNYSGEQDMLLHYSWDTSTEVKSVTILPPSIKENGTKLKLRYYNPDKPDELGIVPEDIYLTIRRNEITRLQFSFDPYAKYVVAKIMVNGQWLQINGMGVD